MATPEHTERSPAARRGDALVDVCRFFLDHHHSRAGGRHRPHLNVMVELDALETGRGARIVDGPALDGPSVGRLLCDCALHRVVMSGGSAVLDYGTSTAPSPPPCGAPWSCATSTAASPAVTGPRCGARDITWSGSPTTARPSSETSSCSAPATTTSSNQPGWHAKLRPDGTFHVTDPQGGVRCTSPPGAQMLPSPAA